MGEAREMCTVFLREERLDMPAFFGIVQLERVVVAGSKEKLSRIIEVEGSY